MNIVTRTTAIAAIFATLAASAFAHEFTVGDIKIVHPSIRATVPGAKVGGGFMTITNTGSVDDRLTGVTASMASDDVQLHEMTVVNDVMKMRQLAEGIAVPAGATVELKPGGLHVMFMNIKQRFVEGETVDATLHFEKAGDADIRFVVGPVAGGAMKHGEQNMDAMKKSK